MKKLSRKAATLIGENMTELQCGNAPHVGGGADF